MYWLFLIAYFFGGAFLMNALPHLVSGVLGRPFQTPFAQPPGKGLSSATVNFLWGMANLVISYLLLCRVGSFELGDALSALALGLGMLASGTFAARHFGQFHGGDI